jgi:hypothetical protein
MVGNGATKWDYDVSPSFPQTVYNFNIIKKDLYDTFMNNDCHYYFNDVKVYNNSQTCIDAWDKISNLTGNLNQYMEVDSFNQKTDLKPLLLMDKRKPTRRV